MNDRLIRAIATDAGIRISAVNTREMVETARQIHKTLPVATAALGRTLSAASMMGEQLKTEAGSVTVQIKGDGVLGTILAVSDAEGNTRGYLQNPAAERPLRPDGKLDVGGAVGKGYLTVIQDVGMKEPIKGMVELVNGEIAADITRYYAESEQVPAACALGVLVDTDQSVRQAGGYLLQLMPGVTEEQVTRLEKNLSGCGSMTSLLESGKSLEEIVQLVLDGFAVEFLEDKPVAYRCACSRDKVTRALISMGKKELQEAAAEGEMEVTCQFCDKIYTFSPDELQKLLAETQKP